MTLIDLISRIILSVLKMYRVSIFVKIFQLGLSKKKLLTLLILFMTFIIIFLYIYIYIYIYIYT